jgi:mono/diheme cytochrome c family protein
MAATDQTYRRQRMLDIVFGVSCVLMLVSVVWMFAQDYNRDFKKVQRDFRDVEEALTERTMLEKMPDVNELKQISTEVTQARKSLDDLKAKHQKELRALYTDKAKDEAEVQSIKADFDSATSLFNLAVEQRDAAQTPERRQNLDVAVQERRATVNRLGEKQIAAQKRLDETNRNLTKQERDQVEAGKAVTTAEDRLKKIASDFDRIAKTTAKSKWKPGDDIRKLPVLDAFNSPVKINQITLDAYPIDYAFKYVTRFDRCMTCHLAADRANYDKESLRKLASVVPELQTRLTEARGLFADREKNGEKLGFDLGDIPSTVRTKELNEAEITQFCAHPRLDLFVDDNSFHPKDKFGCTSCHSGQGSATEFVLASHTPNNVTQMDDWKHKYSWEPNHFWDFPMLPARFVESSCVKCHHQVTDLAEEARRIDIREGKAVPAPGSKVYKGFLLVREAGCFGCHEIAGLKSGREVGPDMRLEPIPPLEDYTPVEQAKMLSDRLNPPGSMRKVGPSLYRLSEKTNERWARRWLSAPRDFRPSTKMPHFYGLSNDAPDLLPADQKDFPNAEIHSIIHYLFQESKDYLAGIDKYRKANERRIEEFQKKKDNNLASEQELRTLEELKRQLDKDKPIPLPKKFTDVQGKDALSQPPDEEAKKAQLKRGRSLFTEKGCLACHQHEGTKPDVASDATFAPDLSRLAAKIDPQQAGDKADPDAKRRWLVQWIMDPHIHSPRSRMPVTHLNVTQAADIAAWLLSQPLEGWDEQKDLELKDGSIEQLARVYLLKAPGMTRQKVDEVLNFDSPGKRHGFDKEDFKDLPFDTDERFLAGPITDDELKWYVGRKAITRLGCYGCHDMPGFNTAKPVGTPLNDWGKKDPERLAFEDIVPYVRDSYHLVDQMKDSNGFGAAAKDGKAPYEKYFFDSLEHHQREGFLHQKLVEPRSYDFNRLRTWDDRLRMPQFKFARGNVKPLEGETPEQAEAREEAEARDAVMTFILGLVAEPVPASYVYTPPPDKLAEVKGRQVLEKFNCAGCHQIRPGIYEFKKSDDAVKLLDEAYKNASKSFPTDHRFPDHNAWVGQPQTRPDRLRAFGIPKEEPEKKENPDEEKPPFLVRRLTEAVRYTTPSGETRDIPAMSSLEIPNADLLARSDPKSLGGDFAKLLVPYLQKQNKSRYGEEKNARAVLPPPLEREGEKVQPGWLFRFLRNPQPVRFLKDQFGEDAMGTVLRMPRFNMSDDEAMTLVNYFSAVDKLGNPAEGLNYPYFALPERDDAYWHARTIEYVSRLGEQRVKERLKSLQPSWEAYMRDQITETEQKLKATEESIKTSKPEEKSQAEQLRDDFKKKLNELKTQAQKKDYTELERDWREKDAYAADAYRLLASYNNPCLSCHQVGNLPPKQAQGPSLNLAWDRLRPEWTLHWLANPDRMLSYDTPMPANFAANQADKETHMSTAYPEFAGTPLQQVTAVRDLLMNLPRTADLPVNRYSR